MIPLSHNISALMRRRALRTAMMAVRGVIGAKRAYMLAAYRGINGRVAIGSGSC